VEGRAFVLGAIGLDEPTELHTHEFEPAEAACVHGAHVLLQRKPALWSLSSDCGSSFDAIVAPDTAPDEVAALTCAASGATFGPRFLAWR
jgi:hypothetical protein